jgi:hypothetical protein
MFAINDRSVNTLREGKVIQARWWEEGGVGGGWSLEEGGGGGGWGMDEGGGGWWGRGWGRRDGGKGQGRSQDFSLEWVNLHESVCTKRRKRFLQKRGRGGKK